MAIGEMLAHSGEEGQWRAYFELTKDWTEAGCRTKGFSQSK